MTSSASEETRCVVAGVVPHRWCVCCFPVSANIGKQQAADFIASFDRDMALPWWKAITGSITGTANGRLNGPIEIKTNSLCGTFIGFHQIFATHCGPEQVQASQGSALQKASWGQQHPSGLHVCWRDAQVSQASPGTVCEQSRLFLSTMPEPWWTWTSQKLQLKLSVTCTYNRTPH